MKSCDGRLRDCQLCRWFTHLHAECVIELKLGSRPCKLLHVLQDAEVSARLFFQLAKLQVSECSSGLHSRRVDELVDSCRSERVLAPGGGRGRLLLPPAAMVGQLTFGAICA
jgi:hypothetical protein